MEVADAEVRKAEPVTVRLGEPVRGGVPRLANLADGSAAVETPSSEEVAGSGGDSGSALNASPVEEGEVPVTAGAPQTKRFELSLETGVLYDDNIFLDARDPVSDVLWRAGAEVRMTLGEPSSEDASFALLRYRPDAYFFQRSTSENTVDHDAALAVRKTWGRLAVDASGGYQRTSGSTVELGDRVPRDVGRGRAGLSYGWGAKTRFSTEVNWQATAFREAGYNDSREWAHETFAQHRTTEKLSLGLGGGYGRLHVDDGSAPQEFQRALMRFRYDATGKISVSGQAGVEFRQTEAEDRTTPVFNIEAGYQMTAKTRLRLLAEQDVAAASALDGQNTLRTAVSLGLHHRFNERFSASVEGGWERYDYEPARASAVTAQDRRDTSVYVRPAFRYSLGERWEAEIWYQFRTADSTDPLEVYDVNRFGFNLGCSF